MQPSPPPPHMQVSIESDQELSVPVSPPASSPIERVQTPFGFSPRKAAIGSSGLTGLSVTPIA